MNALADILGPVIYNLLAWTAQAAALAFTAALIGRVLPYPRARLAFLQIALLSALLLPAVEPWAKPAARAEGAVAIATGPVTVIDGAPSRFPVQWKPEYLLWLAAAGAGLRLLWIGVGLARLRRYRSSAVPLDPPPVPFARGDLSWYVSDRVTGPVTFGASILLPARVAALPADLKEAIACHELIHVERRDWLFVLAEEILRALLWFQPGIWILLAEIQLSREQVVDAGVIALLRDRERYLDALVAVAASKFEPDLAPAPLFLKKRHLAARVAALLKETRMSKARLLASFAGACSAAIAAAALAIAFFPLQSAAQVPAQVNAAAADGPGITVVDPGAPLMHRVGVYRQWGSTAAGEVIVEATLDAKGEVSDARVVSGPDELRRSVLQSVLQWHYANQPPPPASVQIRVKFAAVTLPDYREVPPASSAGPSSAPPATIKSILISGASPELEQRVRAALPVHEGDTISITAYRNGAPVSGSIVQIMNAARQIDEHFTGGLSINKDHEATVHLSLASPAPPEAGVIGGVVGGPTAAPMAPPQRIRVGANVQQANLITKITPAYPGLAKEARIQGVVHLSVVIGKDGTVQNIEVLSGHPLLVAAATGAVKQWVYKPTLLNGNPVEVITQVDVTFTLSE